MLGMGKAHGSEAKLSPAFLPGQTGFARRIAVLQQVHHMHLLGFLLLN
jgi:hypothetical protein